MGIWSYIYYVALIPDIIEIITTITSNNLINCNGTTINQITHHRPIANNDHHNTNPPQYKHVGLTLNINKILCTG